MLLIKKLLDMKLFVTRYVIERFIQHQIAVNYEIDYLWPGMFFLESFLVHHVINKIDYLWPSMFFLESSLVHHVINKIDYLWKDIFL